MAGFCKSMTMSRVVYYLHYNQKLDELPMPSLGGLLRGYFFTSSHRFPPWMVEHCIRKYGCVEDYRSDTFSVLFCQKALQGDLKNGCSLKLLPAPSQIKNNWPSNKVVFFPFSFQRTKLSSAAFSLTFTNGTRFLPSSQIPHQMFCVPFCTMSIPAVCRGTCPRTQQRS